MDTGRNRCFSKLTNKTHGKVKGKSGKGWETKLAGKRICSTSGLEVREAFKADSGPKECVGTNCPNPIERWASPAVAVPSAIWKILHFSGGGKRSWPNSATNKKNFGLGKWIGKGQGEEKKNLPFFLLFFLREGKAATEENKRARFKVTQFYSPRLKIYSFSHHVHTLLLTILLRFRRRKISKRRKPEIRVNANFILPNLKKKKIYPFSHCSSEAVRANLWHP